MIGWGFPQVTTIPLQCSLITELYASEWERAGKHFAPKTLTELYTALVQTLLLRYLSEKLQPIPNIKTLSDLPKCVYEELMQLAKLAAEGIKDHRYVFNEIPCNTMGLMHKEEVYKLQKVFHSPTACFILHCKSFLQHFTSLSNHHRN